ncbi:hypothetical protein DCAR_0623850 [Daucus carota subsp. sativus]|uniref:Uncharacterized protein n=1 Tax=Daucus carota subsp. sativus TaxID=79200 RepID=A0A161ZRH7_DAUCS|nr:hypothetical protein DCAR_0623850 [Daucus carota subsp. sativus]
MSDPHQDLSNCGGADKDGGGFCRKSVRGNVCEKEENRVPLFRFRKLRRKNKLPSSESRWCCFGGKEENVGGWGCFMCFRRSPGGDSPARSDPNSPNFTFELMRSMIEKNDFYSKDCNTHFESEGDPKD